MESYNFLKEKAATTINLLVKEMVGKGLRDTIKTYHEEIIGPLNEMGFKQEVKKFKEDDFIRISFELICFATFVIIVRESPKWFTKRTFFRKQIDAEKCRYFNENLLDYLIEYFIENGFTKVKEIVITDINMGSGFGENLDAEYRIQQYVDSLKFGMKSAIERFVRNFANSIEPRNFALIQPVALNYAGNIIEHVESLMQFIFKEEN